MGDYGKDRYRQLCEQTEKIEGLEAKTDICAQRTGN